MKKKKLRGAIIGYGFIASHGHLPAYMKRTFTHDDMEIVAVADLCENRRLAAKEALPRARIYNDSRALIDSENKLDFVDIATPPYCHGEIAALAMKKGLHVLCEKPLTTSGEEARELLNLAVECRRVLFPCHNYKHAPVIKAIREIIASGRIGAVHSVTMNTFRHTHARGVPEWNTHWRREKNLSGGGIAMDHGSHSFYLAFDWMKTHPVAITAKATNLNPDKYDTEDNFNCVLTFPSGLTNVHLTWTAGVRKVVYALQGENGAITVDDDEIHVASVKPENAHGKSGGATRWETERRTIPSQWMDASHSHWYDSLIEDFKTAMEKKDYANREIQEAALCVRLITAAYQSAGENCREVMLSGSS